MRQLAFSCIHPIDKVNASVPAVKRERGREGAGALTLSLHMKRLVRPHALRVVVSMSHAEMPGLDEASNLIFNRGPEPCKYLYM